MGGQKARGASRNKWIAGVVLALVAGGSVAVGCALDDSAISAVPADGSIIDGGANEASTCVPKKCDNYPTDCHSALPDGCGKTIDCSGACPNGQACVADGGPDAGAAFFCNGAPVCNDAGEPGNSCGVLTNPGNGLQTDCGGCDAGFSCASSTCGCAGTICGGIELCCPSASATPNCNDTNSACCARKACADDRTQCSPTFSNGCGGTLNCQAPSNCIGGQVCDTTNSQCCTEESAATACGTKCNQSVMDNCHKSVTCNCATGTCDNTNNCCTHTVCSGVCCTAAQTECQGGTTCCTPDPVGTTCAGLCGTSNDNCGVSTNCGACSDGKTCAGSANCACGTATCTPGQQCHFGPDHCSG